MSFVHRQKSANRIYETYCHSAVKYVAERPCRDHRLQFQDFPSQCNAVTLQIKRICFVHCSLILKHPPGARDLHCPSARVLDSACE